VVVSSDARLTASQWLLNATRHAPLSREIECGIEG
jgi:hypothetical protein